MHFLLGLLARGNVDQRPFKDRRFGCRAFEQSHAFKHPHSGAILAPVTAFGVGDALQLDEPSEKLQPVAGFKPPLGGIVGHVLLTGSVAKDTDTRFVDVQEAPIDRDPVDAGQAALEEQPVAILTRFQLECL